MTRRLEKLGDWARRGVVAAIVALALVLAGAAAVQAQAQDVSEDEVRAMLDQAYFGAALVVTGAGFELGAPRRLSRRGPPPSRQFDVTLPDIRFTDSEGRRTEFGDITLEIEALGEGRFDMSGELPKEFVIHDLGGSVLSRIRAKRHQFEGIWNANISQFETIDWRSDNWRATDASGAQVFAMSSGRLTATLEQTSPTHGDSVGELELSDISITAGGAGVLRIDRIAVSGEVRNTDLIANAKLLTDFAADPAHDLSDPETLNALNVLIFSNLGVLGDLDYLITIEGLFGRFVGIGPNVGRFSVDSIEFGFGLEGLGDPTGTLRLRYGHRGVDIPIAAAPPGVVPHSVAFSLSFQGLPMQAIFQEFLAYADLTRDGEPNPVADAALGEAMVALLLQVESRLAIDELSLESDILALVGRGTVRPDPAGRGSVTGVGRITIHGLERLQRELLSEVSGETLGYVAVVGVLMALGEEVEDERGRGFAYDLKVGADGKLLINGQDFAPLFEELISP